MTIEQIYNDLQSITERLLKAEQAYYMAVTELKEARLGLAEKEAELVRQGKVKGRNEITRQAELLPYTREIEKNILRVENKMEEAKAQYHYLQNQLENYQICSKLLLTPTANATSA